MAKYVEYIKVGTDESWQIRDPAAHTQLATLNQNISDVSGEIDNVKTDLDTVKTDLDTLSSESNLPLSGGTMTGALNMGTNRITNVATPTSDNDAATKKYVDSSRSVTTTVSVGASSAISISLAEGQAIAFTYTTSRTTNGDIKLLVNGAAPTNANYMFSGVVNGTCFTGGIIARSGSMFNGVVNGVIRLLNNRVIVSTQDLRGDGTGVGYSVGFWNNTTAVSSITLDAAGTLAYNYL